MSPRTFVARSAAILSLAALGLAACESKTIVTPANNPLTIVVSPASVTLTAAGQKAQFVAVVSGGQDTQAKTYSWVSSAPAVATVDANGIVTAVANGVATITATATADANVKSAGLVTVNIPPVVPVTPPAAPTVSIQQVMDANGKTVDLSNVNGQINVALNVDVPTGNSVSKVEVLVDGTSACSQSFTTGSAQVGVEATSAVTVICSIKTDALTAAGNPVYANGSHQITARLVGTSGAVVASTTQTFVFANIDKMAVTVAASKGPATDSKGLAWNGGDLTVNVTPAIFSGAANNVSSVVITVSGATSGLSIKKTVTSATNGIFTATFKQSDKQSDNGTKDVQDSVVTIAATSITSAGQGGPGGSAFTGANTAGPKLRLDNLAPRVKTWGAAGTFNTNSWVNGSFAFTSQSNPGNITIADDSNSVAGSDNLTLVIAAAPKADTSTWTTVTKGSDLAAADLAAGYLLRATVTDALGNSRAFYWNNSNAGWTQGNAQMFGVDLLPPQIAAASGAQINGAFTAGFGTNTVGFEVQDTGTVGLSGTIGIQYKIINYPLSGGSRCKTRDGGNCVFGYYSTPGDTTTFVKGGVDSGTQAPVVNGAGYDSIYVQAVDLAGNTSPAIGFLVLQDNTNPLLGGLLGPTQITGGQGATFNTLTTDDVDLNMFTANEDFGAVLTLQAGQTSIGTYGLPYEKSAQPSVTLNPFIVSVQTADNTGALGAGSQNATQVTAVVTDQADNSSNTSTAPVGPATTSLFADQSAFTFTSATVSSLLMGTPSATTLCNGLNGSDCGGNPKNVGVKVTVTVPQATTTNPFKWVKFFYSTAATGPYILISTATSPNSSATAGGNRTWTWNSTFNANGLGAGTYFVIGVGVDKDGHALQAFPVQFTVQDAS